MVELVVLTLPTRTPTATATPTHTPTPTATPTATSTPTLTAAATERARVLAQALPFLRRYAGAKQTVLAGGDHSFTRWNDYLDAIIDFAGLT